MRKSTGDIDISNMGRCVVCGRPVDMRDEGSTLIVMEQDEIDHPGVDKQDAREAISRALRRYDAPQNHTLATAYDDGDEIVMHEECHDETALPDLYATEEQMERVDDGE